MNRTFSSPPPFVSFFDLLVVAAEPAAPPLQTDVTVPRSESGIVERVDGVGGTPLVDGRCVKDDIRIGPLLELTCTKEVALSERVETALARGESIAACNDETVVMTGVGRLLPLSLDTLDLGDPGPRRVMTGEIE